MTIVKVVTILPEEERYKTNPIKNNYNQKHKQYSLGYSNQNIGST
jgi:hypothetical protein